MKITVIGVDTKELKERGKPSHGAPYLFPVDRKHDLKYLNLTSLVGATRECRLAASKISELTRQAVETLLHPVETTVSFQRE